MLNNPNPRLVVDGHEHPDEESNLSGDGQYAPFYIFDTDAQDYLPGTYESREEAEAAVSSMEGW